MATVPGVYVTIEDRSYIQESPPSGRTGLIVILSDRGEHNKVVEVTSNSAFFADFGKPNQYRHGQAHYLAYKFLTNSNRLYVIRAAITDSENDEENSTFANAGIIYNDPATATTITGKTFTVIENDNFVTATDLGSFNAVNVGDWIFPASSTIDYVRQVISKEIISNGEDGDEFHLILDADYTGTSVTTAAAFKKYIPFEFDSQPGVTLSSSFTNDNDSLFSFYGIGVGSYYNNITIQATRNIALEKMYTDNEGLPLYKYAFMDLTVYHTSPDGTSTILEGPWTCSLMNKVNGQLVRDLNTGRELYLPTTINSNSRYIRATDGPSPTYILDGLGSDKDNLRLQVLTVFSATDIPRINNIGYEGFSLENGSDGIQYDEFGRLTLGSGDKLEPLVASAYSGTLTSTDGSIELLQSSIYPWYNIDYVISGGYSLHIQEQARLLADTRNDCLLLADTGNNTDSSAADITIRKTSMTWNTWNAAIYTQYRSLYDQFNGGYINISPVYHAIDCHLKVDTNYFVSEPVAGIEKGAIQDSVVLSYKPNLRNIEDLIDNELNPVISEPDGTYIITQFTSYKRLSIMKRIHAVKTIHYIKKNLPKLLKDIVQRNGTPYWLGVTDSIIKGFLAPFINSNSKQYSFSSALSTSTFDEERSELFITLTLKPLRAIEAINVNIVVV